MNATDPVWSLIASQAKMRPSHCFHLWHALREHGKADTFNRDAFAMFSQLDRSHIDRTIEALDAHDMLPGRAVRAKSADRATRLPDGFRMPPEWLAWASGKMGWGQADVAEESETFIAFWQADKRTKVSWQKTWEVWCRNSRRPKVKIMEIVGDPLRDDRAAELRKLHKRYEAGEVSFGEYMSLKAPLLR